MVGRERFTMQSIRFCDLELSRLMLGTVQFGLAYGIANKTGQPSLAEVRAILRCAYEGGVNCLDTAAGYGTSEDVLGQAMADLGLTDQFVVVTKVRHMADQQSSPKAADDIVEESVANSLKRLRIEALPICLFHAEQNFRYIESLLKLKDRGLVRHIGSSVVTPEATVAIKDSGQAEALQIPSSVLDHRFTRSGICRDAGRQGIAVFIRSIFLQGLLLMPEGEVLPELAEVIPFRRQLRGFADGAGMSLAELAARYVLGLEGTTCGIVGIETVAQMRENIALFSKGPLDPVLMRAIDDMAPDFPTHILMPNKWSKRMPDASWEKR
jgi:aryl-alcohol dehydrogenase-like predicted oxidoreductase